MTYARFTQRTKWWVEGFDSMIRGHSPTKRRGYAPSTIPYMLPDSCRQGYLPPANPYDTDEP